MKRLAQVTGALLIGALCFAGGVWWTQRSPRSGAGSQVQHYACPMHPQYRSDHPGDCPACGMRLEPERAGSTAPAPGGAALPPGSVHVRADRQQAVGVRLGVAERVSGARVLRTTGRVAPDENATYPIVAGASGWIQSVGPATTGTRVRKHEVLASYYAPEFITVQQSYYSGLETIGRVNSQQMQAFNQTRVAENVQRFADTLRNLGVSERQLAEMTRARRLVQYVELTSPVDGFVLQRNVSTGLRFDRGLELYRIADLRRIWILADVYQHQLPFIRSGLAARVTSAQATQAFTATVSRAEPVFDEATLTLKVRLEAANTGDLLKPGMFVDVELPVDLPPTLVVSAEAIVDSGTRKTVFVDRGEGYFEPRQVETGWRLADQVEVIKGLMEGERIVISGTFLIDSESRMKAAAQGIFGATAEDPVCGMQVDEKRAAAAGRTAVHAGKTYFFCAEDCRHQFQKEPGRYLKHAPAAGEPRPRPVAPTPVSPGPAAAAPAAESGAPAHAHGHPASPAAEPATAATAEDPICGMDVVVSEAVAAGLTSQRDGRDYYFCSPSCKETFDAGAGEPSR